MRDPSLDWIVGAELGRLVPGACAAGGALAGCGWSSPVLGEACRTAAMPLIVLLALAFFFGLRLLPAARHAGALSESWRRSTEALQADCRRTATQWSLAAGLACLCWPLLQCLLPASCAQSIFLAAAAGAAGSYLRAWLSARRTAAYARMEAESAGFRRECRRLAR